MSIAWLGDNVVVVGEVEVLVGYPFERNGGFVWERVHDDFVVDLLVILK